MTAKIETILVPVRHAEDAKVIEYARVFAEGLGASLVLLHIYDPPNEMIGIVPGATVESEAQAERAIGLEVLDRAVAALAAAGFTRVTTRLERAARVTETILRHARHTDLIVMGTHERHGIERLMTTSTAVQIMRAAPCPVIIVHVP